MLHIHLGFKAQSIQKAAAAAFFTGDRLVIAGDGSDASDGEKQTYFFTPRLVGTRRLESNTEIVTVVTQVTVN